ncbi:MAG: histidinol-phosphate transaminase [Bdellovibrionaceae bacterium]|nr:histidinol-phosphate transaminase [Pseudobdellovibrionaceae bacterium]
MKIPNYIKNLSLYKPGKPIEETKREFGLNEVIKLASNENPLGPSPKVMATIKAHLQVQHLYPDPSQFELLQAAEKFFAISKAHISFGNGTDEIIDFLVRIFCEKGDALLTTQYAFQAYEVSAMANQVECLKAPVRENFEIDFSELISTYEANKSRIKIIFLANPNNPTGTIVNKTEFAKFVEYFSKNEDVLLVSDEAYVEFVRDPQYESLLPLVTSHQNLVVLRTFSKIFGMAGLRLGCMIAPAEVVDAYNRLRKPFNVSAVAQLAGIAAMEDAEFISATQCVTWSGIDFFYKELAAMGVPFVPSQGNFVLFKTPVSGQKVFSEMLKKGIILRPVDNYGLPQYLRMSVGLERENLKAIQCLKEVLFHLNIEINREKKLAQPEI